MLVGQQNLVPHERIGRYEVLRKIATGGMAELFLAKQVGMEGFEKVVAIKRILAHLAFDEEFINMFRDEARIVAKLSHPNIVQIYDLGKSDDTYFIAMEYIPGRNLSSVAKKAKAKGVPLPPEYIARCIAQACEGLYYAHTRQDIDGKPLKIVHRDVSPQNIILAFSGGVKLVDFGIAKAATKIAHTRAGVLKGKYAYMSPEQIRGDEVDARSDLFAVGIVLYELLCGRRPFEKENSIQTLKAIVQEPHVDCRVLNSDIPDGLAAIIDKALSKSYHDRWTSAQELQLALEDFVTGTGKRCNNIAISKWVTELFSEELSKDRGGTMVLKGVGEIILPDLDDRPDVAALGDASEVPMPDDDEEEPAEEAEDIAADDGAGESDPPDSLSGPAEPRGRAGGSLSAPPRPLGASARPPIPAPSMSLQEEARSNSGPAPVAEEKSAKPKSSSRNGREMLIEEGVIERTSSSKPGSAKPKGWEDARTHRGESDQRRSDEREALPIAPNPSGEFPLPGQSDISGSDDLSALEEPEREGPPPEPVLFDDSKTEFAPEGLNPPGQDDSMPQEPANAGESTWIPGESKETRPSPSASADVEDVSLEAIPLGPEDDSHAGDTGESDESDVWNEATIGYKDGLPPAAIADGVIRDEPSERSIPTGENSSPEIPSKPEPASWTGLGNGRLTWESGRNGEQDLWDDKTTTNDAYQADDSVPAPVVHSVGRATIDDSDTGSMRLDPTLGEPVPGEPDSAEFSGEHTVALGALAKRREGPSEDTDFSGEISIELPSGTERVVDDDGVDSEIEVQVDFGSRADSDTDLGEEGGSFGEETVAATSGSSKNPYDEPEIGHEKKKGPTDRDARTVAGVTSDYVAAGVEVPESGAYDPKEGIELDLSTAESPQPTERAAPKVKRGGRGLGQIKLEKKEVKSSSFDPYEEMTEAGGAGEVNPVEEPSILSQPMPPPSVKRTGANPAVPKIRGSARESQDFEKSVNEMFEDALASLPRKKDANEERTDLEATEGMQKLTTREKKPPGSTPRPKITTTSEELKPVEPQPLSDSFDGLQFEESKLSKPSAPARGNSLLSPKVPPPLMPPPGQSGPMSQMGSSNVPPANLSLNEMLAMPLASNNRGGLQVMRPPGSRPGEIVPNTPSGQANRNQAVPIRKIRETVRAASPNDMIGDPLVPAPVNAFADYGTASAYAHPAPAGPPDPFMMGMEPVRHRRSQRLLLLLAIVFGSFLVGGAGFLLYQQLFPRDPQLTVRTIPDGASIYLNGQIQPAKTPATLSGLKPGVQYELKLTKEGYETQQKTVLIPPTSRTRNILVNIPLKKSVQATAR